MADSLIETQLQGAAQQARNLVRQAKRLSRVSLPGQAAGGQSSDQVAQDFATDAARSGA